MEVKEQVSKGENAIYFLNIGMLKQQLAFSGRACFEKSR